MALTDLTGRNRQVVQVLRERDRQSRISGASKTHRRRVGTNLNRLEMFGLAEKPKPKWVFLALFEEPPSPVDSIAAGTGGSGFQTSTQQRPTTPIRRPKPRNRCWPRWRWTRRWMRWWRGTAQSARVYRRLVAELPEAVRLALEPITRRWWVLTIDHPRAKAEPTYEPC